MPADNGRSWYGIGLDDSQFQATARRVNRQFSNIGNKAEKEGNRIDSTFRKIGAGVATYFGGRELFQFAKNVAMVRGEFQQLEVAFTTMLKSKSKADALMSDVVKFAATTPYELQDVGKGVKQLLAFQVPAEQITDRLRQIGDLAAGVGAPLNDLVSIYGKVKAKGKLQAEEMNLFLERGIPLVSELAKKYNTTEQAIYKMAEQGKVGFSDLQDVVNNLTGEGGMFFNLMEEQSKTITGQISNLSDAWAQMLNEIGQGNEGAISDAISGAKYLVENYEDVWKILKVLIATYGTYKAAVISFAAIQKASMATGNIRAWFQLAKGIRSAKEAQIAFNLVSKANPLLLLASVITGVVTALILFKKETKETKDLVSELDSATKDYTDNLNRANGIRDMVSKFKDLKKNTDGSAESNERLKDAMNSIADSVPDVVTKVDEYGNVLEINAGRASEFADTLEKAAKEGIQKSLEENRKRLAEIKAQMKEEEKIYNTGKKTVQKYSQAGPGMQGSYSSDIVEIDEKEREKRRKNLLKLDEDRRAIIKQIEQARKALKPDGGEDGGKGATPELLNINNEIDATRANINSLKTDLSNLRSGEIQPEKGNYAETIEGKTKSLKEAEKQLELLIGEREKKVDKEVDKLKAGLKEQASQMQVEIEQARINAIEDGLEKTLAQNELNYKKELSQLKKHRKEREKELKEAGIERDDSAYYEEMQAAAFNAYETANTEAIQSEQKKNEKLLLEYESLLQKRERLKADYETKRTDVEEAGGTPEHLAELERQRDESLADIDNQIAQREASFVVWSEQIANLGLKQLREALQTAQATLDSTSSKLSDKERAVLRAQIETLEKKVEIAEAQDTDSSSTKGQKKKWDDTLKIMNEVQEATQNIISSFDGMDEATKTVLSSAMNISAGVIGMITGIQALSAAAAAGLTGVEKASVILAIVGAAVQVLTALFKVFDNSKAQADHEKALQELMERKIKQQHEYNLLLLEQNLLMEEAASIFGEDAISKAKNSVENYREAIELYRETIKGTRTDADEWLQEELGGFGYNLIKDTEWAKQLKAVKQAQYDAGIGALSDIEVVTGSKTVSSGFFGLGKEQKDVYSGILSVYPDLIDSENRLNIERAKAIVSTEKMSDADKDLLQSMIDLEEQAKEAEEALSDYLSETFGELGSSIMDSLTEAIAAGTDAWEDFGQAGAEVLEKLGKQIAYTLFFSESFKQLENDLKDIYKQTGKSDKEIAEESGSLVEEFYNGIGGQMEAAQGFLEGWDKQFQSLDLWDGGSREGASKGFGAMTQDSADELNGRFTAIQAHTYSISEGMKTLTANSEASLSYLSGIEQNTRRLMKIESSLDEMNTKGLKLRQ